MKECSPRKRTVSGLSMKSARKPIPRSKAWQRGYNSGTNPCKMPKENPYKWMEDRPGMGDIIASYDYYTSDEFQKACRENGRHVSWNSGFTAGRKHTRHLKLLSK